MSDAAQEPLLKKIGADGLPEMTEEEREEGYAKASKMIWVFWLAPRLVCLLLSFLIYFFGDKAFYDKQIATVASGRWGYLYIGVGVFSLLVGWLNLWPAAVKAKLMAGHGNLRANMTIYKVNSPEGERSLPYVVMEDKGAVGEYNRANRSLFHFNENAAHIVLNIGFAGFVFSLPTMICIIVFAVGRVMHQRGYAFGGYGAHGAGFGISMLSGAVLEGLVWITAVQSLR